MATQPFVGEIRIFAGNFAPRGWLFCMGQIMPIQQYTALFSLLGTNYGGNGTSNFQLPDLRGRAPLGQGQGPGLSDYVVGQMAGLENVQLVSQNLPLHTHTAKASALLGNQPAASNDAIAKLPSNQFQFVPTTVNNPPPAPYGAPTSFVGGNLAHNNIQPYMALNFIIALNGVFPARN